MHERNRAVAIAVTGTRTSSASGSVARCGASPAGYNFGLLLRWLGRLLRALITVLSAPPTVTQTG
jgi:hypothetical protein